MLFGRPVRPSENSRKSKQQKGKRKTQPRRARRETLRIEALERRELLAYTAMIPAANQAVLTGDAAADALTVDVDTGSGNLRHNRFGAGDANFASEFDFDTTNAGVQTIAAATLTSLTLTGGGNDTLVLARTLVPATGTLPLPNAALSATGYTTIDDDGNVTIGLGATLAASTSITLGSAGETTSFGSLNVNGGAVSIAEDDATDLFGTITVTSLSLTSGGNITDQANTDIAVAGNANFNAGANNVTLGDNGADSTDFGDLTATGGTVTITEDSTTLLNAVSATTFTLTSGGAIGDNNGGATNITATSATLNAQTGIGSGDALETELSQLTANNGAAGAIQIANNGTSAGALDIQGVLNGNVANIDISNVGNAGLNQGITVNGLISGAGGLNLLSNSPLTVNANINMAGAVLLQATESAGTGDDMTIVAPFFVQSTGSTVTLNVGDNLEVQTGAAVEAFGALAINGDFGNADAAGSTLTIRGRLESNTSTITILGDSNNDAFIIDDNAAAGVGSANQIIVNAFNLFTLDGNGGSDSLTVEDASDATPDTLFITTTSLGSQLFDNALNHTYADFETINLSLSSLAAATDGDNVTVNSLNVGTTYSINANNPAAAPGDQITLNPAGGITVFTIGGVYNFVYSLGGTLVHSNFENIVLQPGNGQLTLLGDEGQGAPGGTGNNIADTVTVVGTGANAGTLAMNALAALPFFNVTQLTIDTFELADAINLTPFATNVQPWGVDTGVDAGAQTDRITYTNVAGLFDDVRVVAVGAGSGRIEAPGIASATTNVAVDFDGTEDVTLTANVGDGDRLAVELTAGNDAATLLFDPDAGDDDLQFTGLFDLVVDTANYTSLTLDGMTGDDTFTLSLVGAGAAVAGTLPIPVTIHGGPPHASDLIVAQGNANLPDDYTVTPGADRQSGTVVVAQTDNATISFTGIENIQVNGQGGTGIDRVFVNGTGGSNDFTLTAGSIQTDVTPTVAFTGFGSTAPAAGNFNVNLLGLGGDDRFSVTPQATLTVNADGGLPGASDEVVVEGSGAADTVAVSPLTVDSGTVLITGFGLVTATTAEKLIYAGHGGNDLVTFNTPAGASRLTVTPGATPDSGDVQVNALVPLAFADLGATGSVIPNDPDAAGDDTVAIEGTAGDDVVGVLALGGVMVNARVSVNAADARILELHTLGGNDSIGIFTGALFVGGVRVFGGDSDAATDVVVTTMGATTTLDLDPDLIPITTFANLSGIVGGAITVAGVEHLAVNGADGTANTFNVDNYGVPSGLTRVTLNGADLPPAVDADVVDIDLRVGLPNDVRYTPLSPTAAIVEHALVGPRIEVIAFNTTAGSLSIDAGDLSDKLTVVASPGNDTISLSQPAAGTQRIGSTAGVPVDGLGFESLVIEGNSGDDTLVVNNTPNLIDLSGGVQFSGGFGFDTLQLIGAAVGDDTDYFVGPTADLGTIVHRRGATLETINFDGLEPVQLLGGGAGSVLTVVGTHESNAIDYMTGPGGIIFGANVTGLVSVDAMEIIEFTTYESLVIDARAGSDTINLNHGSTPTGLADTLGASGITIRGGDPSGLVPEGGDTVIVGNNAAGAITFRPDPAATGATDSATIAGAQGTVTVRAESTEHVVIDGQGRNDILNVATIPGAANNVVLLPAIAPDAGEILVDTFVPLAFRRLGATGSIAIADPDAISNDEAIVVGTPADDEVTISATAVVTMNGRVSLNAADATGLTLHLLEGNDEVQISGAAGIFAGGLEVRGGDSDGSSDLVTISTGSSTLDFDSDANEVTTDARVTGVVGGAIDVAGVENLAIVGSNAAANTFTVTNYGRPTGVRRVTLNGGDTDATNDNDAVSVSLTDGTDAVTYTALSARTATLARAAADPVLSVIGLNNAVNNVNVNGLAGAGDSFTLAGSPANDTLAATFVTPDIRITHTVAGTSWVPVDFTNFESFTILGHDGADRITVGTGVALPKRLDGGDGSDTIDASAAIDAVIIGGLGHDFLTGSAGPDFIDGGAGNDFLFGQGGEDTLYGGEGNDLLLGGVGNDFMFGQAGSDILAWNPGDNNDLMEGGDGQDILQFVGASGADTFAMTADGSRVRFERTPGSVVIDAAGLEQIDVDTTITFRSTLDGAQEVPAVATAAAGSAALVYNAATNRFDLEVFVTGILQADLTMSHIHQGAVGVNGLVIFDLGTGPATWQPEFGGLRRTVSLATFPAANIGDLLAGNTYINIHTTAVGTGEIRGQINLVTATAALGGADTFTVADLEPTEVEVINLGLGVNDAGALDNVNVTGRTTADEIQITAAGGIVSLVGLDYDVVISGSVATGAVATHDRLTVNGSEGDDRIKAVSGVENTIAITLNGDGGNDHLSADAIINGGAGNDFLEGGAGDDTINGGDGDDLMIGLGGNDTFDGGAGFDGILIPGGLGDDNIGVSQTAGVTLIHAVNGVTETDTLVAGTVEEALIDAGPGADIIRVRTTDALFGSAGQALRMRVLGDGSAPAGAANDRLVVVEDGTDDLVVYRKGVTDDAGSITIGPGNAEPFEVVFEKVEQVQFVDDTGAALNQAPGNLSRLVVFKHDPYENNDDRWVATLLGANDTINVDPTIDPGPLPDNTFLPADADTNPDAPGDQDWYRIEAEVTGILDIQVFFEEIAALASGRPGLPDNGNLNIELFDADGAPASIAGAGPTFGGNDGGGVNPELNVDGDAFAEDERIRIPVVAGETYYLRVFGADGPDADTVASGINNYSITVINTAAPTPYDIELADIIESGTVQAAPAPTTTTFAGPATLNATDDFYNGKFLHITSGALQGVRVRVLDYVGATRLFTVETLSAAPAAGAAFSIESFDTGRSQFDNVTRDNTPIIRFRLDDALFLQDLPGNSTNDTPPDEVIPIPFNANQTTTTNTAAGYRVAVFLEGSPQVALVPQMPVGYARKLSDGVYEFDFGTDALPTPNTPFTLSDGSHFLNARVEMIDPADNDTNGAMVTRAQGFGPRSVSLEIVVDTAVPPVWFGLLNAADTTQGLDGASDSGVAGHTSTFSDRITNDTTPTLFGTAEANAVVRLYVDTNGTAGLQTTGATPDFFLGETVAVPGNGTNQFPGGYWSFTSPFDLNTLVLGQDGLRTLFVTGEDLSGNLVTDANADSLQIFLDTQGPRVVDPAGAVFAVHIGENAATAVLEAEYDLFDPKPSTGPTPRVDSLVIHLQDLPNRVTGFLYNALQANAGGEPAADPGHFTLRGDQSGQIAIATVTFTPDAATTGNPATGIITLTFPAPLPDDRYTLTLSDTLVDPAGNNLDGENNAIQPQDNPNVPSGDLQPGGDFVARFTVDSRPEPATCCGGVAYVDINGNLEFDPQGADNDATNRDLIFPFAEVSDGLFAGNFAPAAAATASGYDKLGAYGFFNGAYRFRLDFDHNGAFDLETVSGVQVNAMAVAGNFSAAHPGDEIGLFDGSRWYLDSDGDNILEVTDQQIPTGMRGLPIVGDFNGDGNDDLAVFDAELNRFFFDTNRDGTVENTLDFGFPGIVERPVTGDMNLDRIDDLVLFVPGRNGQFPDEAAEWYYLISDRVNALPSVVFDRFSPLPLGNDLFSQFGDQRSIPLLGNFDPPTSVQTVSPPSFYNATNPHDVNNDGQVQALDALIVINALAADGPHTLGTANASSYRIDVNADQYLNALDALLVINKVAELTRTTALVTVPAEGEPAQQAVAVPQAEVSATGDSRRLSIVAPTPVSAAPRQQDVFDILAREHRPEMEEIDAALLGVLEEGF